jgi:hypothetical protein
LGEGLVEPHQGAAGDTHPEATEPRQRTGGPSELAELLEA